MGTLTLAEIKDEIKASLGNRDDFDTRLTRIINLSQMRIARQNRWEELNRIYKSNLHYTLNDSVDKFLEFPEPVRDIYSFRLIIPGGLSRKLERVPYRDWDKRIPEPEYYARGKPSHYTLFSEGKFVELWKLPDSYYQAVVRACIWPTPLSGDTDTSELDHKDDMLIALAISWSFQTLRRMDDAARWWTIYSNMLKQALAEENENPDQEILPDFEQYGPSTNGEYWRDPFNFKEDS